MQQPHQHGPNCKHGSPGGHGGHGSHGPGGHGHGSAAQMSPQQYLQKLREMKKDNIQFYWLQILQGCAISKYFQSKGLDFIAGLNAQMIMMLTAQAQMMFTCDWMPLFFRPFISGIYLSKVGMFAPLVLLLFFNSNLVYGFEGLNEANIGNYLMILMFFTALFYVMTGLRESGYLNTSVNRNKTLIAHRQKVYLQNATANCQSCKILKAFRAFHCPACKMCVSKFTRHSLAFGVCIGSTNQIFAWLFFTFLSITQILTIHNFFWYTSFGLITQIFFYLLNIYILWISVLECTSLGIFNFYFGITESEIRQWMQSKYLMKIPQGEFENTLNRGLVHNVKESIYAMLEIKGIESSKQKTKSHSMSESIPSSQLDYEEYDRNKNYTVNWAKAFYYITPHIPYHPYRQRIIEIMSREEPRMVEIYKLQKKFKEEVKNKNEGQQLSEFQIQQKVSMKMQQHMMKNNPQMMMGGGQRQQPSPQQQKAMQIQMLTHMKQQMASDPEIAQKIGDLLDGLKSQQISTEELGLAMKDIQQEVMKKRMESVIKQRAQTEAAKQGNNVQVPTKDQSNSNQEEEENLNKLEEIPDEDL